MSAFGGKADVQTAVKSKKLMAAFGQERSLAQRSQGNELSFSASDRRPSASEDK